MCFELFPLIYRNLYCTISLKLLNDFLGLRLHRAKFQVNEETKKNSINVFLAEVIDMRLISDKTDMKKYLKKVEICRSKYRKGSLDLSASYDRDASHVSVLEIDDDRHQIQVDCYSTTFRYHYLSKMKTTLPWTTAL